MKYLGDYVEDGTLNFLWSTNDGSGASVTRTTDGTVSVYKDDGTTQSTAGITDTEDFDGLTGIHLCKIDLSADAFYATGADYSVVLSAATIDGQTVNSVLGHFSIENRSNTLLATAAALTTVDNEIETIDSNVDAILVDTGTTLPATLATIDGNVDAILVDTDTTIPGLLTTIDTVVDTVLVDTNDLHTWWADGGRLDNILDGVSGGGTTNLTASTTIIETD